MRAAVATGLQPLLTVEQAAAYAERDKSGSPGTGNPDPVQFGLFGEAIARRYSGAIPGLPRVRMFEAWNEPNANFFLYPQRAPDGRNASPALYRELVNQFATGVHRVHQDNIVVAGATFPFTINRASGVTIGPYRFLREVLCLSEKLAVVPGCGPPVQLDVLQPPPLHLGRAHPQGRAPGQHLAGRHEAPSAPPEDGGAQGARFLAGACALLGDGVRLGHLAGRSGRRPPWPACALGVRGALPILGRGRVPVHLVSAPRRPGGRRRAVGPLVPLRDRHRIDKPKTRSLQAFRFPFVAFRSRRHVDVWGRVPGGAPRAKVAIERSRGGKWRRVKRLRSDSTGIFRARLRGPRKGSLRARLLSSKEARCRSR